MFIRVLTLAALLSLPASAAVTLSFSKPNSTTLVITFLNPTTFIATGTATLGSILIEGGLGNAAGSNMMISDAFLTNPTQSISFEGTYLSGPALNDLGSDDLLLQASDDISVTSSMEVTLTDGTITLLGFNEAAPADGEYDLFLMDGAFNKISSAGESVPEPSAALLGCAGALAAFRRRR